MGDYMGHRVAPGKYKARITHKGQISETELEIIVDPKVSATAAEWAAQQEFLKRAGDGFDDLQKSVNKMRQVGWACCSPAGAASAKVSASLTWSNAATGSLPTTS